MSLAAASRPHPSNDFINVRIQTTGQVTAVEALGKACDDLTRVCEHMQSTFELAVREFQEKAVEDEDMEN